MAETTKSSTPTKSKKPEVKLVIRELPWKNGKNAVQQETIGINGKNYIMRTGEPIEVPDFVAEIIDNARKSERDDRAFRASLPDKFN